MSLDRPDLARWRTHQRCLRPFVCHSCKPTLPPPPQPHPTGDFMITEVVSKRASGALPFGIGQGVNDYIYSENCAQAHVDCLNALFSNPGSGKTPISLLVPCCAFLSPRVLLAHIAAPRSCPPPLHPYCVPPVSGRAFHISDFAAPMLEHMEPFFEVAGCSRPSANLPLVIPLALATINEVGRPQRPWSLAARASGSCALRLMPGGPPPCLSGSAGWHTPSCASALRHKCRAMLCWRLDRTFSSTPAPVRPCLSRRHQPRCGGVPTPRRPASTNRNTTARNAFWTSPLVDRETAIARTSSWLKEERQRKIKPDAVNFVAALRVVGVTVCSPSLHRFVRRS